MAGTGEVQGLQDRANRIIESEAEMTGRIEINPEVLMGKPVVRNTRIPVEMILRKLSEGASVAELLDGYPRLEEEDVRACLAYAARVLALDENYPLTAA